MSNVFDPPGADAPRDATLGMTTDGMLLVVAALQGVAAALSGFFVVITALATVLALVVDIPTEPGEPPLAVIAPIETAFCAVPTALYGAGAIGVLRRAKWGWFVALVGFALWMGGCGMPFALFGIYALVREEGRKAFGLP